MIISYYPPADNTLLDSDAMRPAALEAAIKLVLAGTASERHSGRARWHKRRCSQNRLVAGAKSVPCFNLAAGEEEGRRIEAKISTISIAALLIFISDVYMYICYKT
jgi:hypothetical protein